MQLIIQKLRLKVDHYPTEMKHSIVYCYILHMMLRTPQYFSYCRGHADTLGALSAAADGIPDEAYDRGIGYRRFMYIGDRLGYDQAVRANKAFFPAVSNVIAYRVQKSVIALKFVKGGYFEITIERECSDARRRTNVQEDCVAIGLGFPGFGLLGEQPGWYGNSFGYHGDDGKIFHANSTGTPFGPSFGPGDTIGCGVFTTSATETCVFFTKNGENLGIAFTEQQNQPEGLVSMPWYPVVGVDSPYKIQVNFGNRPFAYDGYEWIQEKQRLETNPLIKWRENAAVDELTDADVDDEITTGGVTDNYLDWVDMMIDVHQREGININPGMLSEYSSDEDPYSSIEEYSSDGDSDYYQP